jgi:hypothetical protein
VGVEVDATADGDPKPMGDARDGGVSDRELNRE